MFSAFIPGVLESRPAPLSVETRAVAFLDVLGLRELTPRLISDAEQLNNLDYLLLFAERMLSGDLGIAKNTEIRMFSDCICVSTTTSPEDLLKFMLTLESLQLTLANNGVFIRGAVTIGRHFQTPRLIFSEALITAYDLERKVAVFPRIVIDAPIVEALSRIPSGQWNNTWGSVRRDVEHSVALHVRRNPGESVAYLHYLADLYSVDSGPLFRDYSHDHQRSIERWIDFAGPSVPPGIRAKQRWLVDYHNSSMRELWRYACEYEIDRPER